ncbi:uncharacterized protein LOC108197868 isoform X2 [Daucus carota subsp. sativus]|uniref:uncharacterized protein LOC108197868 isoform X2 n=1 Tax=Daucus carota subsp. sativus TaxID=79200 RepID=UPI0007EF6B85|nr:PREDICTED: uncharacterized protein LOC108197868 isoform X2 [Daucus carota subsp. sativus]
MGENNSSNIDPLFWLPSDFLDDDNEDNQLPTEFPYDFTESTRHSASEEQWGGLLGSPQSILSPVLSSGSPNGPSSPTAPVGQKTDQSWNLICAAAGEVNMWKMQNETANKITALPTPPNYFAPLPSSNKNTPVKQNNVSVWGHPFGVSSEYGCGFSGNAMYGRLQGPIQIGWPASELQKQYFNANGSVSHPTFLFSGGRSIAAGGGVGLKRKCAGTGVFLPRTCAGPTDSKVKPGCPASFTPPTRPAQAFNVNHSNNVMTQAQAKAQLSLITGVTSDYDAMLMDRNAVLAQQWRNGAMNCDQFLPREWSY